MRLRFPKSARLSRPSDFARLRSEGVSVHGKFMVLSVLPLAGEAALRIGFITSRRVGGAVERNRARRRFRELVRADRPRIAVRGSLVLVARANAVRANFGQLRDEWRALARRAGVLTGDA
jgi:ribonuclease P protein component